ncbi:MAG: CBS domain-containing protein [Methanothrix sp.]
MNSIARVVRVPIIVLFCIYIGLAAVAISKDLRIHQTSNDLYYATLILAPILAYAIASGKMKLLKIGGLEAEFQEIANQRIEPGPIEADRTLDTEKETMQQLPQKIEELKRSLIHKEQKIVPIILKLYLYGNYNRFQLLEYIEALLSNFESFKLIFVLDRGGQVKAYIQPRHLKIILSCNDNNNNNPGDDFVSALNRGDFREIIKIPGMIITTIEEKNTNIDALKKMFNEEIEILAVVDEDMTLIGIVEQERLLKKILIKSLIEIK